MNQTKKRLGIIKLSISITDEDCIQHQILKLSQIKTDKKLDEIITLLQAKNYAQAQALITEYIETPMQEILQRTAKFKEEQYETQKEKVLVNEFDLLPKDQKTKKQNKIEDINAFIHQSSSGIKSYESDVNYDSLLNLEPDDVMADNIDIDISSDNHDDFLHQNRQKEMPFLAKEEMETSKSEIYKSDRMPSFDDALTKLLQKEADKRVTEAQEHIDDKSYQPIPYIREKFKDLSKQHLPKNTNEMLTSKVEALLEKLQNSKYTEKEIEDVIASIYTNIREDDSEEAAKLLLLCAATPSLYAQFMLARALFRGEILQKNIPEAFSIIYRLANDENYPEAVCDLAQLYEYGIGVEKDIRKAEALYSEAAEMGIKRAQNHVTRIRKENKGLFSRFKK